MFIEVKQFYSFCVCQLLLIGYLNNGNEWLVVEYEIVLSLYMSRLRHLYFANRQQPGAFWWSLVLITQIQHTLESLHRILSVTLGLCLTLPLCAICDYNLPGVTVS